jgi:hypothetical protein
MRGQKGQWLAHKKFLCDPALAAEGESGPVTDGHLPRHLASPGNPPLSLLLIPISPFFLFH